MGADGVVIEVVGSYEPAVPSLLYPIVWILPFKTFRFYRDRESLDTDGTSVPVECEESLIGVIVKRNVSNKPARNVLKLYKFCT